ncbi:MAG: hypothetical protein WBF30_06310 [Candidatus Acidiferrales bacterium]
MPRKLPIRDPIAAHQRKAIAARRFSEKARCACGESRPEALILNSSPIKCYECDPKKRGRATIDQHHVAGKSNSPITIPVPVNDHRARLSADQYSWPKETLENSTGSPLLAAAACIRGFADTLFYLIEKFLLWIPEMLETLDAILVKTLGPKWWRGMELEKYVPKR